MSASQSLLALFRRDFLIAFRHRHQALNSLLFFVLVCFLFPLGVGSSIELLKAIAPGIIWIAALLAILMSLEQLFRADFEDGSLELMVLANQSLLFLVMTRVFSHWLMTVIPLLLLAPIMATAFGISSDALFVLIISLLLGTPVLSLVGAIASALTIIIPHNGMLLALLVLPLYVPVLIFGTSAVNSAEAGLSPDGPLYILAALLVLGITLSPPAIAAALRTGVSQ
jgi:heme exporter protein B